MGLNEQKAPNGIEWTRIIKEDGTRTRGFTWNVAGGCMHGCQWQMPDGTIAGCYAKGVAEKVATRAYPHGFEHHYWHPSRLEEPLKLKDGAGIFLDSMADLMGHWVEDEQIEQVLDVCRRTPQHTYFLLTKNAPRLLQFEFPNNVWTGVSSPPDWMFGKRLSRQQQEAMLHRTMKVLSQVKSKVCWISFEPLSWDCSAIIAEYPGALQWAVIGGASNGRHEFPPALDDLLALLNVLDRDNVPVFYKGNLRTVPYAVENWRELFPTTKAIEFDIPDHDMPWQAYEPPASQQMPDLSAFDVVSKFDYITPFQAPGSMQNMHKMPTRVVSFHDVKGHWDRDQHRWDSDEYVYIGRHNVHYGLIESPWANPFHITEEIPRDESIRRYRAFILTKLELEPGLLAQLEALRGKTLVCWCAPKHACHGDVLIEMLGDIVRLPHEASPRQLVLL